MDLPSRTNRLKPRTIQLPFVGRFSRYVASLPASDKAVVALLGLCIALASVISFAALLRAFQETVPAFGGTLSEGVVGSPRFVNPLLAISDSDRDLVELTYAGLMGHAADGTLIPVLAQSYTVSNDGTVYTFKLRSNAAFSDGTPVTADDVVYTVQKAQDPGLKSPVYASWVNIRATALDAQTVKFTLSKAYTPFLEDATLGIMPQHIWKDVSDEQFPFSPYSSQPIAAGPFTASSISRNSQGVITKYEVSAFKEYSLGRPHLSHIRFSYFSDQTTLAKALQSGSVASAYGIAGGNVKVVPYARVFGVFFNQEKDPAFKDLGVRKALSLAIDRTALTEQVLGGYAAPIVGPLPKGSGIPDPTLPDDATRMDDAKKALDDSGYTYDASAGTWSKSGKELTVTLTTSNAPELKAVAAEIQKDWLAIGIPSEIEVHDPSTLTQTVIRPRAYSALLFGEIIGTDPDLYAFWAGSEKSDPGLNIADYENKNVDTLLEQARSEASTTAKQATLSTAVNDIAADYPAAFLYTPDFIYRVPKSIHNLSLSRVSSPSDRFWGVANWYLYEEHVWPIFTH